MRTARLLHRIRVRGRGGRPSAAAGILVRGGLGIAARAARPLHAARAPGAAITRVDLRGRPRGANAGAPAFRARAVRDHVDRFESRCVAGQTAGRRHRAAECGARRAGGRGPAWGPLRRHDARSCARLRGVPARLAAPRCHLAGSHRIGQQGRAFPGAVAAEGIGREALACLASPIGVPGITSKAPTAIAIAISAQLLQQAEPGRPGSVENAPACDGRCDSLRNGTPAITADA